MALLSSHLRFATDRYWFTARWWGRTLACAVLAAGLAYLGYQEVRLATEYVLLKRAARAEPYSVEQMNLLEQAFAIELVTSALPTQLAKRTASSFWKQVRMRRPKKRLNGTRAGCRPIPSMATATCGTECVWTGWSAMTNLRSINDKADQLDPNGYYTAANIGWHYIQTGNYAAARPWFERSLRLEWRDNTISPVISRSPTNGCCKRPQSTACDYHLPRGVNRLHRQIHRRRPKLSCQKA